MEKKKILKIMAVSSIIVIGLASLTILDLGYWNYEGERKVVGTVESVIHRLPGTHHWVVIKFEDREKVKIDYSEWFEADAVNLLPRVSSGIKYRLKYDTVNHLIIPTEETFKSAENLEPIDWGVPENDC